MEQPACFPLPLLHHLFNGPNSNKLLPAEPVQRRIPSEPVAGSAESPLFKKWFQFWPSPAMADPIFRLQAYRAQPPQPCRAAVEPLLRLRPQLLGLRLRLPQQTVLRKTV